MNGWEWSYGIECDGRKVWQGLEGDATALIRSEAGGWNVTVWDLLCDAEYEVVWTGQGIERIIEAIENGSHPSMWFRAANRPQGLRIRVVRAG